MLRSEAESDRSLIPLCMRDQTQLAQLVQKRALDELPDLLEGLFTVET